LMFYKKALSYFMPNRLMHWNAQVGWGNPTKSSVVNDLIRATIALETAGRGKPSQARRDFQKEEFDQVVEICKGQSDLDIKLGMSCLLKFAYHLIARLDCSSKLKRSKLQHNPRYLFTLRAKLEWSKNVREERQCPWQILLGANDPDYCILIALGLHCETSVSLHGGNRQFIFNFGTQSPKAANRKVSTALSKILNSDAFERLFEGLLGMHSTRKFSTTLARSKGASKDEADYRARWKTDKRQQDKYANVDLPWPDGKVAGLLCIGGPIKYCVNPNCGVTKEWILQHVVPNITNYFPSTVAEVLGTAVLWAIFDEGASENIPVAIVQRVGDAFTNEIRGTLGENENPVTKVPLVLYHIEGVLHIEETATEILVDQQQRASESTAATRESQLMSGLYARMNEMQRTQNGLKQEVAAHRSETKENFRQVHRSLNRISRQPGRTAHPRQNQNSELAEEPRQAGDNARLCRGPKTLHALWEEWISGIGGMKPARLFTAAERGRVKHVFSKRKVFWDKISTMVQAGMLAETAIDKVYQVYGEGESVTSILKEMQKDRKARRGHPELQV